MRLLLVPDSVNVLVPADRRDPRPGGAPRLLSVIQSSVLLRRLLTAPKVDLRSPHARVTIGLLPRILCWPPPRHLMPPLSTEFPLLLRTGRRVVQLRLQQSPQSPLEARSRSLIGRLLPDANQVLLYIYIYIYFFFFFFFLFLITTKK